MYFASWIRLALLTRVVYKKVVIMMGVGVGAEEKDARFVHR